MVETIFLDGSEVRETGTLRLRLERQIQINVLAEEARRLVNQFVHMELSTQMHAEVPMLVVSTKNEAEWRVPVHLTSPAFGDAGCVGFLCVDPVTGSVDTAAVLAELANNAKELALRFASPTTYTG